MAWHIVMHLFSALVDWFRIGRLQDHEKHLEILILRQQLGIAERTLHKPVRVSRVERLTLAVLTTKLRSSAVRSVRSECLDKIIVINGVNARFANKYICAQY